MLFLPLAGLALGAAGMYLLDPEQGRRRRSMMRDKLHSQSSRLRDAAATGASDLRNRMRGAARQTWAGMNEGRVPDRVLVERVRSKIGRHVSHPAAVRVAASDGKVVLKGSVLAQECDELLRVVGRIRGVRYVEDCLQREHDLRAVSDAAARAGSLQMDFLQEDWSPAARAVSGTAGTMLVMLGLHRRGLLGVASSVAGAAMLLRAASNRPLSQLAQDWTRHGATKGSPGGNASAGQPGRSSASAESPVSPASGASPGAPAL